MLMDLEAQKGLQIASVCVYIYPQIEDLQYKCTCVYAHRSKTFSTV